MTSQLSSLDSVLDRLATVEAQNRSIRRAGAVVLSLVGAVLIMAQARPPSQTVEAERLVLRDAMGMARIVLSSGEGEGGAASLTLSDANGNPRGMLVVLRDGVAGVALRDQRGRLRLHAPRSVRPGRQTRRRPAVQHPSDARNDGCGESVGLVAGAARQERQNRVSGAINEEPPIPRGLVLNSGGRTRTDDPRIMNLGPSGWRRGQEVFDGERIGGALTRAAAVRCRPEADALQTGMLRRLSGERLTILKPMGRVSEVIRFGNVIDLRRTERRQGGVRIIQNSVEELIVCGACRIDVAVEIDATGRYRQAVIDHEF